MLDLISLFLIFFIFVFVAFHILMEKRLTFSKKMKIYHDTKIPLIFLLMRAFLPSFKIDYKNDWLLFFTLFFFFGFKMSFCLKL